MLWLVLGLTFLILFNVFSRQQPKEPEKNFSDFFAQVEKGEVASVTVQGRTIHGKLRNDERFKTFAPDDPDLIRTLRAHDRRRATPGMWPCWCSGSPCYC